MARLVAKAFEHEQWVESVLGFGEEVPQKLTRLVSLMLRHQYLPHGAVDLALDGDELVGAALWSAPDGDKLTTRLAMLPAYLRLLGPRLARAMRIESMSSRMSPNFPHWYLSMLAVAPNQQGRGIGSVLLNYRLALLPEDQPVYLEASSEGSARLYARHGFVTLGQVPLGGGRAMQGMWHPAARTLRE